MKLFTLFAKHFHVEVTMGLDPILVDFDCESPDQPQGALLIGKDADDMGAAFELLVKPLKHIDALEMLVVLSRQPVEGKSFLDVLFDPRTEFGVFGVWGATEQKTTQ